MTKEPVPELALLPDNVRDKIITTPEALFGEWIEADKPLSQIIGILSRLGLSAVKRRIVARCHCKVRIEASTEDDSADKLSESTVAQTPTRVEDGTDVPSTAANTPLNNIQWGSGMGIVMRQHFPMGRVRESAFVADGETVFNQEDDETDSWRTTVWLEDGVLVQRRESEKLGILMYDTRAILSEAVEVDNGGKIEGLIPPVQLFQWVIIDLKKNNEVQIARYYLMKTEDGDQST